MPTAEQQLKEFSSRLKGLRTSKKMTQDEAAQAIGCVRGRWNNWETGKSFPKGTNLDAITKLFNVTSEYILYGTGADYPQITAQYFPILEPHEIFNLKDHLSKAYSNSREYYITYGILDKNCFAMKLKSDSMQAISGVSFPSGGIILFTSINGDEAKVGDFVLAKRDPIVDFKMLSQDGFSKILKPLNPHYTATKLDDDIEIIAKAIKYEISIY